MAPNDAARGNSTQQAPPSVAAAVSGPIAASAQAGLADPAAAAMAPGARPAGQPALDTPAAHHQLGAFQQPESLQQEQDLEQGLWDHATDVLQAAHAPAPTVVSAHEAQQLLQPTTWPPAAAAKQTAGGQPDAEDDAAIQRQDQQQVSLPSSLGTSLEVGSGLMGTSPTSAVGSSGGSGRVPGGSDVLRPSASDALLGDVAAAASVVLSGGLGSQLAPAGARTKFRQLLRPQPPRAQRAGELQEGEGGLCETTFVAAVEMQAAQLCLCRLCSVQCTRTHSGR